MRMRKRPSSLCLQNLILSEFFLYSLPQSRAVLEYTGNPPRIHNLINQRQGRPSLYLGVIVFCHTLGNVSQKAFIFPYLLFTLKSERVRKAINGFSSSKCFSILCMASHVPLPSVLVALLFERQFIGCDTEKHATYVS